MRFLEQLWRAIGRDRILVLIMALCLSSCDRQLPTGIMILNDFESAEDLDRIAWRCRTTFNLSGTYRSHGQSGLLMTLYPGPYPGLSLFLSPAQRQWLGYRFLVLDVFNPGSVAQVLHYRIDDSEAPDYGDRVNGSFTLRPGKNQLRLDLAGVRTSGTHRPLDLNRIRAVLFFQGVPRQSVSLGIDYIRLEATTTRGY